MVKKNCYRRFLTDSRKKEAILYIGYVLQSTIPIISTNYLIITLSMLWSIIINHSHWKSCFMWSWNSKLNIIIFHYLSRPECYHSILRNKRHSSIDFDLELLWNSDSYDHIERTKWSYFYKLSVSKLRVSLYKKLGLTQKICDRIITIPMFFVC